MCDHDPQNQMQLYKLINSTTKLVSLENADKLHKGDVCIFLNRLINKKKIKIVKTKHNQLLVRQMINAVWDKEKPLKKEGIDDDLLDTLIYAVSKIFNKLKFLNIFGLREI